MTRKRPPALCDYLNRWPTQAVPLDDYDAWGWIAPEFRREATR